MSRKDNNFFITAFFNSVKKYIIFRNNLLSFQKLFLTLQPESKKTVNIYL
jgi:hypothetical protein